ncbi:hypothetical protein [Halocella sp. SP3-1]|uniref:hypothetical protein n=1 Tax=Halocella sp. SP3-1 TaxID=2382161 RepID=UPI000F74EE93|nr:hypothetical protein [Halocella sp. SP3-1]AZO95164.1 hypothetical protein D7D81_11535 [Halocella sp. SP3-1]
MNDKKTEQLQINLPVEIKECLLKQAVSKGMSNDEFINKILADYAEKHKDENVDNLLNNEKSEYKEIIDELLEILRKF